MIDVLVASTIFSVLVVVVGTLLALAARSDLTSSTRTYGGNLAASIVSEATASRCGAATGYGTSAEASSLAGLCTWGQSSVSSLGDVAMPGVGQYEALCPSPAPPSPAQGVPGPACYQVTGLNTYYTAGLSFSWEWAAGGPDLATISNGEAVASPPDELVANAVVGWRDGGAYVETSRTDISSPPSVLTSGWAGGGMGVVLVAGLTSGEPVGLVVTGWSESPIVTATCPTPGQGCSAYAVFAYVPAGSYQVWAGQSTNLLPRFSVIGGQWSTVSS